MSASLACPIRCASINIDPRSTWPTVVGLSEVLALQRGWRSLGEHALSVASEVRDSRNGATGGVSLVRHGGERVGCCWENPDMVGAERTESQKKEDMD